MRTARCHLGGGGGGCRRLTQDVGDRQTAKNASGVFTLCFVASFPLTEFPEFTHASQRGNIIVKAMFPDGNNPSTPRPPVLDSCPTLSIFQSYF
ncbi:hypothetical protein O3P69_003229 [Scylla paramamosain]|uniref:Uncharacterized protein n=1 Tax=Scylla paramamosain TaxID=85552 RepID=A0AAW0UP40_SCYPA